MFETNTIGILVTPIAEKIQMLISDRGCRYRFRSSDAIHFEVVSGVTTVDYLVNLEQRTCSCFVWQSTGFPCGHALAIIMSINQDPQAFSKHFFQLDYYRKTYENTILHPLNGDYSLPLPQLPITDEDDAGDVSDIDEDEDSLLPPSTRRPAGRPKKHRIRATAESDGCQHRQNRCSRCKGLGHSRRTCREAI